eukprot:TRINITY_DN10020_c0_g1_i1.p1 TRINITY_DN10020_c0_g1~~TRINITY_DN10020_c0_g1_i1.p1  ORF type:complete len:114 (+),score=11.65 TRINITY_DN10020_c0_g1_i1:164-505(+)
MDMEAFLILSLLLLVGAQTPAEQCYLCKSTLNAVEAYVATNPSVDKSVLYDLVTKSCTEQNVLEWCNKNILPNETTIFDDFITDHMNVTSVCQSLTLCDPLLLSHYFGLVCLY